MKTFEDFGVALGDTPPQYGTGDAAELAVATYNSLGLLSDAGKARSAFSTAITSLKEALPQSVTSQPYDIVMVPKLGELSLDELVGRYDELTTQKGNPRTAVWGRLWDKYSADDFNQGQTVAIEARAVLLGGENDYDEPGLYFTKQNLKTQRESFKEAQKSHEGNDTVLGSLSVAGYMVRNAMQLERGEKLMDRPTYTRFIELDSKRVDGISCVPGAGSRGDGRVDLDESFERANPDGGVRLSVGQK